MSETENTDFLNDLQNNPMFTQDESDDDNRGELYTTDNLNVRSHIPEVTLKPKSRAKRGRGAKKSNLGKLRQNQKKIKISNKLFQGTRFDNFEDDEMMYGSFGVDGDMGMRTKLKLKVPEEGSKAKKFSWLGLEEKTNDGRMEEEKISGGTTLAHKAKTSPFKVKELLRRINKEDISGIKNSGDILKRIEEGVGELDIEIDMKLTSKSDKKKLAGELGDVIANTLSIQEYLDKEPGFFQEHMKKNQEKKNFDNLKRGPSVPLIRDRNDLKRVLNNKHMAKRSQNLDIDEIKGRFKVFKYEKKKDEEEEDEDYVPPEEGEDENISQISDKEGKEVEEKQEDESGKMTMKQIMALEADEDELQEDLDDFEDLEEMKKLAATQQIEEEKEESEEPAPKKHSRLMKNKEARKLKKERERKKREENRRKRQKKAKELQPHLDSVFETQAELGEIDQFGREVVKSINPNDAGEVEGEEENINFLEGLINDEMEEGDEENMVNFYRRELMKKDEQALKRILKGGYTAKKSFIDKIEKDKKFEKRVKKYFLGFFL